MSKRIPITTAKAVAEKHSLRQVILLGWDGVNTHVVTYGVTRADCDAAAQAQDFWTGKIKEFALQPDATASAGDEEHEHVWREDGGDHDLGGNRTMVECTICGVPGERNDDTGEVYWPAT